MNEKQSRAILSRFTINEVINGMASPIPCRTLVSDLSHLQFQSPNTRYYGGGGGCATGNPSRPVTPGGGQASPATAAGGEEREAGAPAKGGVGGGKPRRRWKGGYS